jgi:hypothetical protein
MESRSEPVSLDEDSKFFRTNDMGVAAYLKMLGHPAQQVGMQMRGKNHVCYWYFLVTEGLLRAVDGFIEGTALVSPKEYNKFYSIVKAEFFDARRRQVDV